MLTEKVYRGSRHDQIKYLSNTKQELLYEAKLYWLRDKGILPQGEYYVDVQSCDLIEENIAKKVDVFYHLEEVDNDRLRAINNTAKDVIFNCFNEFDYWCKDKNSRFDYFYINIIPSLPTHRKLVNAYRIEETILEKLKHVELEMDSPFNNEERRFYSNQQDNIDIISSYIGKINFYDSDKDVYDYAYQLTKRALGLNMYKLAELFIKKGIYIKDEPSFNEVNSINNHPF